jgi:hypothetical protein
MLNPFGMGNVRGGLGQAQSNQPYNFKGLEDRLGKLETGIAGLTDQFKNFQIPGQQTVDPIYTGGTEPNPLAPATPTGGISSLPEAQDTGSVPPPTGGIQSLPGAQASGQTLTRTRGPLSLTEKLRNEYRTETGGPLTMGEEWDARAKEMGFDFRKQVRQLDSGEWAATGQGADHFNKLFEEAGGVLDRPEYGAAARYGEGFTNWLGDKGYQLHTEKDYRTEPGYQSSPGIGGLMGGKQDMSWYTPYLSQYAMTAEEMQDPEGTLKARRNNLVWPTGSDTGTSSGLPPGLEGFRGGKLNPKMTNLSNLQQQGIPPIGLGGGRERPGWTGQPRPLQQALQAGVGSLQGPTQQKIKQGYQV